LQKQIPDEIIQKGQVMLEKTFRDMKRMKQINSIHQNVNEEKEEAVSNLQQNVRRFEFTMF
jgi:hypothetical protein